MENLGGSNINTESLLLARGVGLPGYGYGYGAGMGPYASPTANAIRTENVGQKVEDQADCTRSVLGLGFDAINSSFENATRAGEFARVCDAISRHDVRNSDGQFRAELRGSDQAAAIAAQINDLRAETSKCCCETKLELAHAETRNVERHCELKASTAAIDAKIDANQKFMELFAENQSLKTQVACGCSTGCSRNCHGHHG